MNYWEALSQSVRYEGGMHFFVSWIFFVRWRRQSNSKMISIFLRVENLPLSDNTIDSLGSFSSEFRRAARRKEIALAIFFFLGALSVCWNILWLLSDVNLWVELNRNKTNGIYRATVTECRTHKTVRIENAEEGYYRLIECMFCFDEYLGTDFSFMGYTPYEYIVKSNINRNAVFHTEQQKGCSNIHSGNLLLCIL